MLINEGQVQLEDKSLTKLTWQEQCAQTRPIDR